MANIIQYQYEVGTKLFFIDKCDRIVRTSKINELIFDGEHIYYRLASGDYVDEKSINCRGYMFSSFELAYTFIVDNYEFIWIQDFIQHDKRFVTWLLKQNAIIKSLCEKNKSFAEWYKINKK